MRGEYVIVDETGVHLVRDISDKYRKQVMGGLGADDLKRLQGLSKDLLKIMTKEKKVMVFKYLGQQYGDKTMFSEITFKDIETKDKNIFKNVATLLTGKLDNQFIIEWSD